jgi:hypothetical protein
MLHQKMPTPSGGPLIKEHRHVKSFYVTHPGLPVCVAWDLKDSAAYAWQMMTGVDSKLLKASC